MGGLKEREMRTVLGTADVFSSRTTMSVNVGSGRPSNRSATSGRLISGNWLLRIAGDMSALASNGN